VTNCGSCKHEIRFSRKKRIVDEAEEEEERLESIPTLDISSWDTIWTKEFTCEEVERVEKSSFRLPRSFYEPQPKKHLNYKILHISRERDIAICISKYPGASTIFEDI
jgi:hypothetical protein